MRIDREAHRRLDSLEERFGEMADAIVRLDKYVKRHVGEPAPKKMWMFSVFDSLSSCSYKPETLYNIVEALQNELEMLKQHFNVTVQSERVQPAKVVKVKKGKK